MIGRFGQSALARLAATAALLGICVSARAADLGGRYTQAPVIAASLYDWSGFYAGGNFGGTFGVEDLSTPYSTFETNPSGVLGGVQLGYNFLFAPNWLLGIEGELDWTTTHGVNLSTGGSSLAITSNQNWYDTLDGRLGMLQGSLLYYIKGGVAWTNADYLLSTAVGSQTSATWVETNRTGWNLGAGLEYMLAPRWSAKLEYNFLDFGGDTLAPGLPIPGTSVTIKTQIHEIKFGVNYHWLPGTLFGIL